MLRTLKNPRGQSALEFSALIIFVMMAILIGGPYVVRSINSYFKSLEEGAIDSERETITESVPAESLPECDCNPVPACGDGATQVGGVVCAKTRRIFQQFSCLEPGCYNTLLAAGQIPAPYCGDDLTNTCCDDVPAYSLCANDSSAIGPCVYGEREEKRMCGSPTPVAKYDCVPDSTCDYRCQTLGNNAKWCVSDIVLRHQNLPSRDFRVNYVAYGSSCPGTTHCEAMCDSGLVPTVGGCQVVLRPWCSFGGFYAFQSGFCTLPNILTGSCSCPSGHNAMFTGYGWMTTAYDYQGYLCESCTAAGGPKPVDPVLYGGAFTTLTSSFGPGSCVQGTIAGVCVCPMGYSTYLLGMGYSSSGPWTWSHYICLKLPAYLGEKSPYDFEGTYWSVAGVSPAPPSSCVRGNTMEGGSCSCRNVTTATGWDQGWTQRGSICTGPQT